MRTWFAPTRRGAALLIVLGTLALTMTAATILASAAATSVIQRRVDQCTIVADDLLVAAEVPIQDWLSEESARVVLPPESTVPAVAVLHDRWTTGGIEHELIVTAFDQCGMAPLEMVRNGSPIRLAISTEILRELDSIESIDGAVAGLDIFIDPMADPRMLKSPYPSAAKSTAIRFGFSTDEPAAIQTENATVDSIAIGSYLATHNRSPFRINVNTAPIPLIEAALRLAGRGGLEQIIAARSQGKPAGASGQTNAASGSDPRQILQFVATGTLWAFRIDAKVGPVRKSWWAIYAPAKSKANLSKHQFECVQRLVITH